MVPPWWIVPPIHLAVDGLHPVQGSPTARRVLGARSLHCSGPQNRTPQMVGLRLGIA